MGKTIYKNRDMIENELEISQGDIFCNLPYFTYDYIVKSDPNNLNMFRNERDDIYINILKKGGQIQFEGFIDAHWGILASQDCDIRPNKDLIFFPLEKTTPLYNSGDIVQTIDDKIINTTRRLYLPKIDNKYGPFEIIFHNPFNVPYDLIIENLKYCWKARIIESARKIFIGKLSYFYSRVPIEDIIFLENREITKYFVEDWKKFWKKEKEEYKFQNRISRIEQAREALKFVKRHDDLNRIFYFDLELLANIKKFLGYIKWFNNSEDLLLKCREIESNYKDEPNDANLLFKEIINKFILTEDSILDSWKEFFNKNADKIREIRMNKKKKEGFFPDNLLEETDDYINLADNAVKARNLYDKFPSYLKIYSKLINK